MEMFYDEKLIFLALIYIRSYQKSLHFSRGGEDLSSAVRADLATVQTENKGERQYIKVQAKMINIKHNTKQGWSRLFTFQ